MDDEFCHSDHPRWWDGTAYSGRGLLGATLTNYYWNALNADSGQAINVTANRDDGGHQQRHYFQIAGGHQRGTGSSLWTGVTNNMLLTHI